MIVGESTVHYTEDHLQENPENINPPMAKGGGCHPPTGFSNFPQKWEKLFCKLNFHL